MSVPANPLLLMMGSEYVVPYSLRFRASNSAYLTRTPGSTSNRKTWAWSGWVKRGLLASQRTLFFAGATSTTAGAVNIFFDSSDRLNAIIYDGGTAGKITSAVFRDPSAFYNILVAVDTTQATGTDRVKIYVNGVQLSAWATDTAPTLNMDTSVNNTTVHYIGCANDSGGSREGYFDGVIAEPRLLDGQTPTASSFGQTSAASGQWVPKAYSGTYGTNGAYLKFADASAATAAAIGKDSSGNGNNWTPSGISVTAGSTFDQMSDTPTNNYATLNPLVPVSRGSLRNANLEYTSGSTATHGSVAGPVIPTTGEWCWEVTACKSVNNEMIGVANIQNNPQLPAAGTEIGNGSRGDYGYRSDGNKYNNGSGGAYGATYTANDIIGVVWNSTAGTLTFFKNGTSQGTAYSSITQVEGKFAPASSNAETGYDIFNFGQRPFAHSYGSAKALNTTNLSTPAIPKGSAQMNAVLYTGTGSSLGVTGVGFQPDLVWIKGRSGATDHALYDAVRGAQARLESNTSDAEATADNGLTAFGSDGFTVNTLAQVNTNTATYVGWAWKEGVTPGFDIVTYTGNATNRTINHSLGAVPHLMLVKNLTSATGWTVYHRNMDATPQNGNLTLNSTAAYGTDSTSWNNTAPTSSVFSVGTANAVNGNTNSLINYLWTSIPGFSLMGSYTGNGSTDGPFVWCGFKPRFILIKRTDTAGNGWWMVDTVRQTYNQITNGALTADSSAAEGGAGYALDVLSNGFKARGTGSDYNTSGATYIFAAFAESPFKYATAR